MRSHLRIFDLATGKDEVLLDFDGHLEAPNWDGMDDSLIVNADGRLFRVPLGAPDLQPIDTGHCVTCNNDHGLTPDGKQILLSDQSETGQSVIYRVPAKGGRPVRITEAAPSYWHGVSPDGVTIVYVGRRGDSFQVYSCSIEGGPERQLTERFDHCDGPEFTPDGEWIWFNGEVAGAVNLWRMRPDGADLQQMTDDDSVNWFPHPSPDGTHMLYLAYAPGTQGHPPLQDVHLRLMPAGGGPMRDLVALHGGQGTINVPCWAPDSRRFAFVSYET